MWAERVLQGPMTRDASAFEMLRRPEVSYDALLEIVGKPEWMSGTEGRGAAGTSAFDDRLPAQIRAQVEVRAKYAGYIERQEDEVERQRRNEETRLPDDLDYLQVCRALSRGPPETLRRSPGDD